MNKQMLSIFQWRCLLVVLGLLLLSLDVWASMHWERSAVAFRVGTLGVSLGAPDRNNYRQIVKIADGSPLLSLSATPGSAIKFDHPEDSLRVLSTDEPVGLTLRIGRQFEHAFLTPMPDPLVLNQPFLAKAGAFVTWAQLFITLLLAMLIGWIRAASTAMRVFALLLLNNSPFSLWNILPSGTLSYLLVDFRLVNLWIVLRRLCLFFPNLSRRTGVSVEPMDTALCDRPCCAIRACRGRTDCGFICSAAVGIEVPPGP